MGLLDGVTDLVGDVLGGGDGGGGGFDPDAMIAQMEESFNAMMETQMKVNQMSQEHSMETNMAKSLYDTNMSVANNFK